MKPQLWCIVLVQLLVVSTYSNVNVVTTIRQIPGFKASIHSTEVLLAIGENCRSPQISTVHVLIDHDNEVTSNKQNTVQRLKLAIIRAQQSSLDKVSLIRGFNVSATDIEKDVSVLEKLDVRIVGTQPSYVHMFKYADYMFPHRIVAIQNADIILRNLDRLDEEKFDQESLALTLAVSVRNGQCGDDECAKPQGWSWDVHIFKAPLAVNYSLLEDVPPGPVLMNSMGAENRVGYMLSRGGYSLSNPCKDIIAEHWHCGPKEHAGRSRVDASVEDVHTQKLIREQVIKWGIKPKATTKFFWVPRSRGGPGVKELSRP